MSVNDLDKVLLIGRLTEDPREHPDGRVELTVLTAGGTDTRNYHTVVVRDLPLAARCLKHLSAAKLVYVEGRLCSGPDACVEATHVHFLSGQQDVDPTGVL